MKKNYIYIVFRTDPAGTSYWFAFSNRKAAEACAEHGNKQAFCSGTIARYHVCKEQLYNIW